MSDPLRVLAVTLRYPPHDVGGYEQLAEDVVEGLRGRGHRVDVLCGASEVLAGREGLLPWLEPRIDRSGNLFELSHRGTNLDRLALHFHSRANARAARRAIEQVSPEVMLYLNLGLVSLAPLHAARQAGLPKVGIVCDMWPANHWIRDWREQGGKRLRRSLLETGWRAWRRRVGLGQVLVPSESIRAALEADGLDPGSLGRLPLGLSADLGASLFDQPLRSRAPGAPLEVICTSAHWEGKGIHVLLEAAAIARGRGADLRVTLAGSGEGAYVERLRAQAATAELEGSVEFVGRVPHAELTGLLARAHVFVFPSLWDEPYARAPMEAMAAGLALVASDAGGTPEQFEHGQSGLGYSAHSSAELAERLLELCANEPRREALARAGREHARSAFSFDRYLEGLERVLANARATTYGGRG